MSNNINGRGKYSALSSVDFYRRVPKDLTEVRGWEWALVVDSARCALRTVLV
jgi:hypothetical protein